MFYVVKNSGTSYNFGPNIDITQYNTLEISMKVYTYINSYDYNCRIFAFGRNNRHIFRVDAGFSRPPNQYGVEYYPNDVELFNGATKGFGNYILFPNRDRDYLGGVFNYKIIYRRSGIDEIFVDDKIIARGSLFGKYDTINIMHESTKTDIKLGIAKVMVKVID